MDIRAEEYEAQICEKPTEVRFLGKLLQSD